MTPERKRERDEEHALAGGIALLACVVIVVLVGLFEAAKILLST